LSGIFRSKRISTVLFFWSNVFRALTFNILSRSFHRNCSITHSIWKAPFIIIPT
jgi:hypothetical protein